ncbi:hypothetical protein AVEN_205291-1 [Araneus ventricosus]|uniref:Uncharacterized protein n=1 Tax=Araneus ventricosus TaxID=182803 RepID=A0A4Y2L6I5_ARAVE|nr:hypothetical protein AVEN_205291-1 [Araneus ventricosus]
MHKGMKGFLTSEHSYCWKDIWHCKYESPVDLYYISALLFKVFELITVSHLVQGSGSLGGMVKCAGEPFKRPFFRWRLLLQQGGPIELLQEAMSSILRYVAPTIYDFSPTVSGLLFYDYTDILHSKETELERNCLSLIRTGTCS